MPGLSPGWRENKELEVRDAALERGLREVANQRSALDTRQLPKGQALRTHICLPCAVSQFWSEKKGRRPVRSSEFAT